MSSAAFHVNSDGPPSPSALGRWTPHPPFTDESCAGHATHLALQQTCGHHRPNAVWDKETQSIGDLDAALVLEGHHDEASAAA